MSGETTGVLAGKLTGLSKARAFRSLLGTLRRRERVVYSKPPFDGPEHVLKSPARYPHRVASLSGRLLSLDNGQVRFRWRCSRHNNRGSVMKLDAVEFARRLLIHLLSAGFVKLRHFGLLANRNRPQSLARGFISAPPLRNQGRCRQNDGSLPSTGPDLGANAAPCLSSPVLLPLNRATPARQLTRQS